MLATMPIVLGDTLGPRLHLTAHLMCRSCFGLTCSICEYDTGECFHGRASFEGAEGWYAGSALCFFRCSHHWKHSRRQQFVEFLQDGVRDGGRGFGVPVAQQEKLFMIRTPSRNLCRASR